MIIKVWFLRETIIINYRHRPNKKKEKNCGHKMTVLHKEQGCFLIANIIFAPQGLWPEKTEVFSREIFLSAKILSFTGVT
jgi:hypothetical protein